VRHVAFTEQLIELLFHAPEIIKQATFKTAQISEHFTTS
jgi:hypothetical protein